VRRLAEPLAALRAVLASRDLRRLQLSWLGSVAGEFAYTVALSVYAYREGGATGVGLVWLLRTLPAAAGAPFAALLADRYRRGRVLLAANLVRAAATAGTVVAVAADAPWAVFALAVVVAVVSTLFWPAQAALLPALARTPAELTAANTASTTLEGLGSFAGPAVCGALLAVTSVEAAFAVIAAVFVLAAAPLAAVSSGPGRREGGGRAAAELVAGFRTVAARGELRLLVGTYGIWAVATGALNVLVVVAAIELLDLGEGGVGLLNAAVGVGGLAGALAALALVSERNLARVLVLGALVWSVPLALVGAWPEAWAAVALLAVLGVGNILLDVSLLTLLQRAAPAGVQARVFGIVEGLWVAGVGIGAAAVPALIALAGSRAALVAAGLLLPAVVLAARGPLARIEHAAPPPAAELALLRGVPFLAPLPEPALEQLARALERLEVAPGTEVVRAGEPGDRFYVVAAGDLAVRAGGGEARTLGPGDFFGEIALLRDVPRTATVVTRGPAELVALDRDAFLDAVSRHPASAAVAALVLRSYTPAREPLTAAE
jgi:MFS family permease